jgi:hypothetical protein
MAEKRHALLSPSSADTWMQCAGAAALYKGKPDTGSKFAREGSCAHEVAELVLKTGKPATDYIGHVAFETTCDADMAAHVQTYADAVRGYLE